jgi:tetratricopeptide (TPR) repeat protein
MGSYGIKTEIEPEVTAVERETLSQVMQCMSEENMQRARLVLEKTITPDTSALFDFILGNIFFQEDQFKKAAQCYERAIAKFPDFLRAHKNLAMVKVRNGEFNDAIRSLTRTIELGEGNALTYGLMGYAYTSVENYLNSETAYRQAMMLQPDAVDWQLGLAQSLFKQEKYADAASLCNRLITQYPDNPDYWRLQANAYLGTGEPLKAAQNYEYLRSMGIADAHSLNKLGDIYVKEKMLDIAADAYIESLEKETEMPAGSFIRNAKILAGYSGLDEASRVVQKIKEVFTDSLSDDQMVELLRIEARIALNKGADEKQAELLREIVRINPMDGEALILLGQYHERKNNPEKAVFCYERAEAIEGVEAKAKIQHAQLLVQMSKYQEAVPLLESALRIHHRSDVEEYLAQVKAAAKSGR